MEDKESERIYLLKIKYLNGETTENETAELLRWINSSDENKALYFHVKDITEVLKNQNQPTTSSKLAWKEILLQRDAVSTHQQKAPRKILPYIKYAAAILLLAMAGYYYLYSSDQYVTLSVSKNQAQRKVELPDHSLVWLKPGSSIRFIAGFNAKERLVNLRGDAFFEVNKVYDKQGKRKPFTIKTSRLDIQVLGTSFNVVDQKAKQEVMVSTGVVRVRNSRENKNDSQIKILHPGDRVKTIGNVLQSDHINADLYMGWTNGNYHFDNTSILELKEMLETNYDCEVIIKDASYFNNRRISGHIRAANKSTLLNILSTMLGASITNSNYIITIQPLDK